MGLLSNHPLLAEPAVETTLLAPANAVSIHLENTGRVAAVVRQGSRLAVTIDGEEGPRFDRLFAASGDPMRGRTQFPALSSQDKSDHPVMFSHDGRRYGYIGLQGEEDVVIVDGKEVHRAPYDARADSGDPHTIHFSPKGNQFWVVARHDPGGRPRGFAGMPSAGQRCSAMAKASCIASSARSKSPSNRMSVARIRPPSFRKTASR
jgi:hypothetical protein